MAPRLAGRFRLVAYDQRGHGLSGKPDRGYGFESLTEDAVAVIRSLRLGRPVVLGHSWGAAVALELAVRRPRLVEGAILLDGGVRTMRSRRDWKTAKAMLAPPELDGIPVDEWLARLRGYLEGRLTLTPALEEAFRSLVRVDREGRIHRRLSLANHLRILRALWEQDTLELLRGSRVPTLVLLARTRVPSQG
ncbi:MAG: alpha/beta fold hydrolase, partial [Actinomycetota bacterium]